MPGEYTRFTKEHQPERTMTPKQTQMAVRKILGMTASEIEQVIADKSAPLILRMAAKRLLDGDCKYVAELAVSLGRN